MFEEHALFKSLIALQGALSMLWEESTNIYCNHKESQTHEKGAGEKESGLFLCWPPEKTEDSHPKVHLPLSTEFCEEGEEKKNRDQRERVDHSLLRRLYVSQHSLFR